MLVLKGVTSVLNILYIYRIKGSLTLRPGEKIREFEGQNFVHCLVSMCSSMY